MVVGSGEGCFAKAYTDQPTHSPFFGRLHEIGALEAGSSSMDFHSELGEKLADLGSWLEIYLLLVSHHVPV
jgi:hypothetical protein